MSVDCPPAVRPRNASAAIKAAEAHGWKWECKLSAGFSPGETELTWSVVVRVARDGVRLVGSWEGPAKDDLGWYGGWRWSPQDQLLPVSWTTFSNEIKGVTPKPTPKAEAELLAEQQLMLRAISALKQIAWPIAVLPSGTKDRACKGKTVVGTPGLPFLPCGNFTAHPDEKLCPDACGNGVLGGTEEAKPASKKKTEKEQTGDLT